MDVKQAVQAAKEYVLNLYDDEDITDVGLEEVEFVGDPSAVFPEPGHWQITIGFSRPWDKAKAVPLRIAELRRPRSFKVVSVNDTNGKVISLKDRG